MLTKAEKRALRAKDPAAAWRTVRAQRLDQDAPRPVRCHGFAGCRCVRCALARWNAAVGARE